MCSDYDNPYGMSDQEFQYRAMNPEDPMYMGGNSSVPTNINSGPHGRKKHSKDSKQNQKHPMNKEDEKALPYIQEDLFVLICFLVMGLLIAGGIWLLSLH